MFELAIWIESAGYDPDALRYLEVPSQSVKLTLAGTRRIVVRRFHDDGSVTAGPAIRTNMTTLAIGDRLTMIEIEPGNL